MTMRTTDGHRPPKPHDNVGHLLEVLVPAQTRMNEHLEHIHEALRSIKGVQIAGSEPREITTGPAGQSMKLSASPGRLTGYALRETSGAAGAVLRIRDGGSVTGGLMVPIALGAGESVRDYFDGGIAFAHGLYFEIVSGVIEGVLLLGTNGT